jgi:GTP-binding protein EngB required for normal cell division
LRELLRKSAIDLVNNLGAASIFFTESFGTSKYIKQGGDIMEQEKKEAQVKVESLEARLKEWGIDLEKFRAKVDKIKGNAKAGPEREVAALQAKLKDAKKKLEELKKADAAASAELKKGIENAWAELKKAFDSAKAKFK